MPRKSLRQQLLEKDIDPPYEDYDGVLIRRYWRHSSGLHWINGCISVDYNYKIVELHDELYCEKEVKISTWHLSLQDLVSKGSGKSYGMEQFEMDCGIGWTLDEAFKVGINFVVYDKLPDLSIGKSERDGRVQVEIDRKVEDRRANAYQQFLELKEEFGFE